MVEGLEVALRVDQTLTQDATGTLVMLELEALGVDRARTEVSVQYVDHNLLQADERNAEDHLFLRSAARRFGLWFPARCTSDFISALAGSLADRAASGLASGQLGSAGSGRKGTQDCGQS
jgi:hypothetical protein